MEEEEEELLSLVDELDEEEEDEELLSLVDEIEDDPSVEQPLQEKPTAVDNILNNLSNAWTSIKGLPDTVTSLFGAMNDVGADAAEWFANNVTRPLVGAGPVTEEQKRQFKGEENIKAHQRIVENVIENRKNLKPTLSITREFKEGDALGVMSAVLGTTVDVGRSLLTGAASAGSVPIAEMVGNSYIDGLEAKAESEGVSVEQLIDEDNADEVVPLTIGLLGGALERVGLKGITKQLFAKLPKQKAIGILTSSGKEGLTEWIQFGLESANKAVAGTKEGKIDAFNDAFIEAISSEEGLNAAISGMAGAGVITTSGHAINKTRAYFDKSGNEITRNEAKELQEQGEEVIVKGDEFLQEEGKEQIEEVEQQQEVIEELPSKNDYSEVIEIDFLDSETLKGQWVDANIFGNDVGGHMKAGKAQAEIKKRHEIYKKIKACMDGVV